jgi:dienelactone hydrolase
MKAPHRTLEAGYLTAVGYCFGGMVVLELARSGMELARVVSVRGAVKAKTLVCHRALDPYVAVAQVSAFVHEMNQAGSNWQLMVYGGAMHGFYAPGAYRGPGCGLSPLGGRAPRLPCEGRKVMSHHES